MGFFKALIRGRVEMDGTSVDRELNRNIQTAEQFKRQIGSIGRSMATAFSVGAIVNMGRAAIRTGSELSDLATAVRADVEAVQALIAVGREHGATQQDIFVTLRRMNRMQGEVKNGNKSLINDFRLLGIAQDEVLRSSPEQMLQMVAEGFRSNSQEAGAYLALQRIIGDESAPRMIETLGVLADTTLPALIEKFKELNEITSSEDIEVLDNLADGLDRIDKRVDVLSMKITTRLVGGLMLMGRAMKAAFMGTVFEEDGSINKALLLGGAPAMAVNMKRVAELYRKEMAAARQDIFGEGGELLTKEQADEMAREAHARNTGGGGARPSLAPIEDPSKAADSSKDRAKTPSGIGSAPRTVAHRLREIGAGGADDGRGVQQQLDYLAELVRASERTAEATENTSRQIGGVGTMI